ncbi:DUF2605 domain-containing protein [Lyngbya confervoides]|uniref:DUF2605 domain-containing protein n=1 Tax=Lyngbya confervoides BDU141951 TaxID=1574623 RepID=A0ABD4T544_9CYAN|nr:DUF2605 domain-containing protein [Lyngbya confervoides]MCM1983808.1 DUF2605 domain-containing protein [Lyngbya confervoides BDU141951]
MRPFDLPDQALLKSVLEPLFEDFQHWFGRTQVILQTQTVDFLSETEQAALLHQLDQAMAEVTAAQALFGAMGAQAGVETTVLMNWHQLVTQCWQVIMRSSQSET